MSPCRLRFPRSSPPPGWIHGPGNDGFIKLIADADAGMLIGATSAGPAGGEVLGALAVAVHAGVPVAMLSQMIYAYPTLHRAIEEAIAQLSFPRARSNHGPRHSSQGRAASAGPSPSPARPSTARWNALNWQRAAPARTVIP